MSRECARESLVLNHCIVYLRRISTLIHDTNLKHTRDANWRNDANEKKQWYFNRTENVGLIQLVKS